MIVDIHDDNVEGVVEGNSTFLLFFYSVTNVPLHEGFIKMLEDFDKKLQGKIIVYKCEFDNCDNKLDLVKQYFSTNVLPSFIIMKNKKFYANVTGHVSISSYENAIKNAIINISKDDEMSNIMIGNYSNFQIKTV